MRLLLPLFVVLSGCAMLTNARMNSPEAKAERQKQMEDMNRQMDAMREANRAAEKTCGELREREVSYAEEQFVGGRLAVGLLEKTGAPTTSDDVIKYVAVVGRNLARYSSRPDIAWNFGVIENDAVRSFSAPAGYVFVTTAALKKMRNEAQLAGVLGHEIGNVTSKRGLNAYKQARYNRCTTAMTSKAMLEAGVAPADAAAAAKYAKNFEHYDLDADDDGFAAFVLDSTMQLAAMSDSAGDYESDKIAAELMAFAGYDLREFETWLSGQTENTFGHAPTTNRIEKLKALREGELAPFATGTAKPDMSRALAPLK